MARANQATFDETSRVLRRARTHIIDSDKPSHIIDKQYKRYLLEIYWK